jgi:hypothetical protein
MVNCWATSLVICGVQIAVCRLVADPAFSHRQLAAMRAEAHENDRVIVDVNDPGPVARDLVSVGCGQPALGVVTLAVA